jgi:gluconolactonase
VPSLSELHWPPTRSRPAHRCRRDWSTPNPTVPYPDANVQVLDPRFKKYIAGTTLLRRIWTGAEWTEGPVWFGDMHCVIFSDIPNNRLLRYDTMSGDTTEFRSPSNFTNGNTRDRQGRLVSCEHAARRVTRTEYDGKITVLTDNYQGKKLNSPNGVVVKSDDSIWFTDPSYGTAGDHEGHREPSELPHNVYRIDGKTAQMTWWLMISISRTGCVSHRMRRSCTSLILGAAKTASRRRLSGCTT